MLLHIIHVTSGVDFSSICVLNLSITRLNSTICYNKLSH